MSKRIIGVDVDGVLADFNTAFIDLVIAETGRDLFPTRPFDIPTWHYPQHYGYTEAEIASVWSVIETSHTFWYMLPRYPDTKQSLAYLGELARGGADVYFVTSRPGSSSKLQTEAWLSDYGIIPTVLISSAKGLCSRALNFDAYIDDRWENVVDVVKTGATTVLIDRPWNRDYNAEELGIIRTSTVAGFADAPVATAN